MSLKLSKLDKIFSYYIRLRVGFKCQRCGKVHSKHSRGLHCAHYWSRGRKIVRWYSDNAASLCYGCHVYLDHHPLEKAEFFAGLLGTRKFNTLNKLAQQTHPKPDKEYLLSYYQGKIRRLENVG